MLHAINAPQMFVCFFGQGEVTLRFFTCSYIHIIWIKKNILHKHKLIHWQVIFNLYFHRVLLVCNKFQLYICFPYISPFLLDKEVVQHLNYECFLIHSFELGAIKLVYYQFMWGHVMPNILHLIRTSNNIYYQNITKFLRALSLSYHEWQNELIKHL